MRVAIFSDNLYPELSGIVDSVLLLGRKLAQRGHTVRYYGPRYVPANFKKVGLPVKELDMGSNVSVHRFFSIPVAAPTGQGRRVSTREPCGQARQAGPSDPRCHRLW